VTNLVLSVTNLAKGLRSFYSCAIEWDNINLIIAYDVYYDYYKIDRNKQSKITVHETDILNSYFTEDFYQQSRLTAVEQITFHDTKIKHFTFHANKYWPFTAHENTLSHPLCCSRHEWQKSWIFSIGQEWQVCVHASCTSARRA
jgi:hypothetical protein